MRKFPEYNLIQELTMQAMMILLIIGYVAYDFMKDWSVLSYLAMAVCGVGILLLFRKQMTSMHVAKIISVIQNKDDFRVKRNFLFPAFLNLVVVVLTAWHFYLYAQNDMDFNPLYTEYGVGLLLGAGIWVYDLLQGQLVITEQGVVVGSKLRPSIIRWSAIEKATSEKGTVSIKPKATFGVKLIEVRGIRATQQLTTLLRIHNKMK
jgi:hypothetical protein